MNEGFGSVLIVGGGISGIQAALDVANQGFKVYLVEKTPSIGGSMARLDKTFPTNDCSICIEAPKMVDILSHPNIELLTNCEVKDVKGSVGNFKVKIVKKPRYVLDEQCNGCGRCEEVCIVAVPSEFDLATGPRKAIYVPFRQATPNIYTLDMDNCRKLGGGCRACVGVCRDEVGRNAIDFWQTPREFEVNVGGIIVANGFNIVEPRSRIEYGYGIYKNVMTALQYERILSAVGPTMGRIVRPSDGREAGKIAWIQCVMSRDDKTGVPYCSRVCCTYATKQAIITKEHDPNIETYVFYIDQRNYGKGFEDYHRRAEEIGVRYIRCRPGEVIENSKNGNLLITYEDVETSEINTMEVDMLILCSAIIPSEDNRKLSELLGINLDRYGFYMEDDPLLAPFETNRKGVHVCGCCRGPADIPSSTWQASGASAKTVTPLVGLRGKETKKIELPPEIEVKPSDQPRIGIFICDCGDNIKRVVNVPEVVDYAKTLPNVVLAEESAFTCSADYQMKIKDAVKKYDLNRVIVAACTPRTHEYLFRRTCREVGLNPYLFEFANIREHCSWVHSHEPELATWKAKELVKMAIAKAALLEPEMEFILPVGRKCLVIGGGIAGMTAALALAEMGFEVRLIEKEKALGGLLRRINEIFPYDIPAEKIISDKVAALLSNKNIEVYTEARVKNVEGYIGNFTVTMDNATGENAFKVSIIIVATGFKEIEPRGYYGYGEYDRVVTQLQLEQMLRDDALRDVRNVVMINCVGAREENGRTYCCSIGCGVSLKNAKYIKEQFPDANVYILYQDMVAFGKNGEEYYSNVVEEYGAYFIRYSRERKPEVCKGSGKELKVKVYDTLSGDEVEIEADMVVLTVGTEGSDDAEEIAKKLKIPVGSGRFLQEAHMKLRPLDTVVDGVYICGCAHGPKSVEDSIHQAIGAAMRASVPMAQGTVVSEGITAVVDSEKCKKCGLCVAICPYKAITLEDKATEVIQALCKGCGVCAAECPQNAITMRHFTDEQISSKIEAALMEKPAEKILAFCCNWCGYAAADLAGVSRFQYASNVRVIRVMCSGRVDPDFIYKAFKMNAGMVLVIGCELGTCHYISGNARFQNRIKRIKQKISSMGADPDRFRVEWLSAAHGKRFSDIINEAAEHLRHTLES